VRVWAPGKRGYRYGYEIVYPHQTRTLEAGGRVRSAVQHQSLKWQIADEMLCAIVQRSTPIPLTMSSNPTSILEHDEDLQTATQVRKHNRGKVPGGRGGQQDEEEVPGA